MSYTKSTRGWRPSHFFPKAKRIWPIVPQFWLERYPFLGCSIQHGVHHSVSYEGDLALKRLNVYWIQDCRRQPCMAYWPQYSCCWIKEQMLMRKTKTESVRYIWWLNVGIRRLFYYCWRLGHTVEWKIIPGRPLFHLAGDNDKLNSSNIGVDIINVLCFRLSKTWCGPLTAKEFTVVASAIVEQATPCHC